MRKVTVLLIGPVALAQLIGHLFRGKSEFEIVGRIGQLGDLPSTSQHSPALIVASVKPIGTGVVATITSIKKFSPSSKLILISPVREFARGALAHGADACLDQEKLVFHLLPTARGLSRNHVRFLPHKTS